MRYNKSMTTSNIKQTKVYLGKINDSEFIYLPTSRYVEDRNGQVKILNPVEVDFGEWYE